MKKLETFGVLEVANRLTDAKTELINWHKTLNGLFSFSLLPILLPCLQIDPIQGFLIGFTGFICIFTYFIESQGNNALQEIYTARLTPSAQEIFRNWKRVEFGGSLQFKRTPVFWFVVVILYVLLARVMFSV